VQAARKKAGLEVDDRIKLSIDTEISGGWQDVLKTEVLAVELGRDNNYQYDEVVKLNGKNITISLKKAKGGGKIKKGYVKSGSFFEI
jgi:hypothetical protein